MRLGLLGCLLALVTTCSLPAHAEQPRGPATLEGLAQDTVTEVASTDTNEVSTTSRPAGTLVRPKDGVQHPDLDKAWAVYQAAVDKAAEGIRTEVTKQFEAAAAKGNLDATEKWQVVGESFEKKGTLPAEKEIEREVKVATDTFVKARDGLKKAYEEVVKTLTKQALKDKGMLQEAQRAKAEWKSLGAQAVLEPRPGEWVSIFDGVRTDGWGNGWGEKVEVVQKSLRLQGQNSGLKFMNMAAGESLALEAKVNIRRIDRPQARAKLGLSWCDKGSYWMEVDEQGKGVIAEWDQANQRLNVIKEFRVMLRQGQWHVFRFERLGNQLVAYFDNKEVAKALAPKPVLPAGKAQIAVGGLMADFTDLKVIDLGVD